MKLEDIYILEVNRLGVDHLELRTDWDNDFHTALVFTKGRDDVDFVISQFHQQIKLLMEMKKSDKNSLDNKEI